MEEERIEWGQRERDRLRVLHEVEQGHLKQREAGARLRLSEGQIRRLLQRVRQQGDRGVLHGLRGRSSNRKFSLRFEQRVVQRVRQRYADFGPTLAREKLEAEGLRVSRETLRRWMSQAGVWRPRSQRARAVHVWRARRSAFGELVMMDSSPYAWLEERGPAGHLVAMIDDATSRIWGRFVEHDTTEENMRTLWGWVARHGRPLALYTDKNGMFVTSRAVQREEQLQDQPARTQFGRALAELGIEWIAAHSPQAKGRIERFFSTAQDRLVKEMRLAGIDTLDGANRFLKIHFIPEWEQRFAVPPRHAQDAHQPLGREQRLEEMLRVRATRVVTDDHTVSWEGRRWGLQRESVGAGLRRARVEIERRLDGSHWLRFRGRYLPLHPCFDAPRSVSPSGLRPPGPTDRKPKPPTTSKTKHSPAAHHPWRKSWKRTFLLGTKPDISTLR
jgi:transposase